MDNREGPAVNLVMQLARILRSADKFFDKGFKLAGVGQIKAAIELIEDFEREGGMQVKV